jgi:Ras homolog gene family, member A
VREAVPQPLPELRDLDQPFVFDISLWNRPYRFEFFDTASPESYTLIRPSVIVLCYSIVDRSSLTSIHNRWKYEVETHFNYDEQLPVILLGLKRDLRSAEDPDLIIPHEGLKIAQEMRCDRYAECSAITGELCREVFEDLAKTAAMTTTAKGGKSDPTSCVIM